MGRKTKALEEIKDGRHTSLLVRVVSVVRGWGKSAWESFIGPRGYLALVTLLGAYVGYYSIVEARHERRMNRASFERATFMSMVSSGNPASFTAAMITFGQIQNTFVPVEPTLLAFWTWFDEFQPNSRPLKTWSGSFFASCNPKICGDPIDLIRANLSEAYLIGARLSQARLSEAYLSEAYLRGAYLIEADLSGADLSGADLRGAINLTREQIESAFTDEKTQLPDYLKGQEELKEK